MEVQTKSVLNIIIFIKYLEIRIFTTIILNQSAKLVSLQA